MSTYFGIVNKDPDSAFGIHFPDVPGCFSATDKENQLLAMAQEALSLSAEYAPLPDPSPIEAIRKLAAEDLAEGAYILAVPVISLSGRTVRANVTMDQGLLHSLDEAAKERRLSRSAFIAQAVRHEIERRA